MKWPFPDDPAIRITFIPFVFQRQSWLFLESCEDSLTLSRGVQYFGDLGSRQSDEQLGLSSILAGRLSIALVGSKRDASAPRHQLDASLCSSGGQEHTGVLAQDGMFWGY